MHAGGEAALVQLDQDHPGFRDATYRQRRNAIARLALEYRPPAPVPDVAYTAEETQVWRTVMGRLAPLHQRYACRAYLECSRVVGLDPLEVPQLRQLNAQSARLGGFQLLPVAGLVSERMFLEHLGRDVFLATQYMRHHSRPLYTPEPDVIHELVGHAVTLADPGFLRLNRAFGRATLRASDAALRRIARVYWYTMEFGAVEENGQLKVMGAGLLSSAGEMDRFEREAQLRPFNLEEVQARPYDPTNYQAVIYVAPGFDRMAADVEAWLDSAELHAAA